MISVLAIRNPVADKSTAKMQINRQRMLYFSLIPLYFEGKVVFLQQNLFTSANYT